jgi:hypothetical protein
MYSTMTSESFNKLEIYDAGDKSLSEMRRLTASIFDVDPDRLGLMRVDLCVDVYGVDVGWFKRHTIVQSKQTNREFGVVQPYITIQKGQTETLYAGVKPNQYRLLQQTSRTYGPLALVRTSACPRSSPPNAHPI